MEEPIPGRFKILQLKPYDGTTNLLDHLKSYKALMRIQDILDALLCYGLSLYFMEGNLSLVLLARIEKHPLLPRSGREIHGILQCFPKDAVGANILFSI